MLPLPVLLSLSSAVSLLLSSAIVIIGIVIVVFIMLQIGKFLLQLLVGLVLNSILGFIALAVVNYFFGITLTLTTPVILAIALFGLPAVGTLLILKMIGGIALAVI